MHEDRRLSFSNSHFQQSYQALHSFLKALGVAAAVPSRFARVLMLKVGRRSDYKRWTDSSKLEIWWISRTEKIAQMIPQGSRVIEFGAGRRQLEKLLGSSCSYVASDLIERGPGTIVCDLNKRPLPDLKYLAADVAVFAGVLEYIRDLDSVVEWLASRFRFCIASYDYFGSTKGRIRLKERLTRHYHGYMNNYTEAELVELFRRRGYLSVKEEAWQNQRIFLFAKQETTPAAS
jgi:hypothetical protein